MKIISRSEKHAKIVQAQGTHTINGVTFRAGDEGWATAYGVGPREVNLFLHAQGFTFYHDDGTHAGDSGNHATMTDGNASADVPGRKAQAVNGTANPVLAGHGTTREVTAEDVERHIENLLKKGELPDNLMKELMKRVPVIGEQTGEGKDPVPPKAGKTEKAKADKPAMPEKSEAPHTTPTQDNQDDAPDGALDMSDPAALAKLDRSELFGLASNLGVEFDKKIGSKTLAERIADAFKTTNEYLIGQAIAAGRPKATFALHARQPGEEGEDEKVIAVYAFSITLSGLTVDEALASLERESRSFAVDVQEGWTLDEAPIFQPEPTAEEE